MDYNLSFHSIFYDLKATEIHWRLKNRKLCIKYLAYNDLST